MKIIDQMPARNPRNGTFELTVRCNLHCKMCLFRHDDCENSSLIEKEMSAAEWIHMAEQVADAGTLRLLITGGEPMLRPDFCEIWEGIYKQGFLIQLYTNATLVTDKVMDTLRKYPPHDIGVTVYGSNPDVYEKVCGDSKAFNRMVEGIHKLQTLPSRFCIRTTIIKDNYPDVESMEAFVAKEFDYHAPIEQTQCVLPAVRGGNSKARECRLDPADNVQLIFHRGINQMRDLVGRDEFDLSRVRITVDKREECRVAKEQYSFFGCNAGMTNYTISYDGALRPCQIMEPFTTDARKDGFNEAWRKLPYVIQLPESSKECWECKVAEHCQTCYASRLAETGTLTECPKYIKEIAEETSKIVK